MTFVRVALDVPVPTLFDYRAEHAVANDVGSRVLVPFGKKVAVGVIFELAQETTLAPQRVRNVLSILRDVPPLSNDILMLLKFSSDYYHHPIGQVVMGTLPTRLRRRQVLTSRVVRYRYQLTVAGQSVAPETLPARAVVKRKLLELLRSNVSGMEEDQLRVASPRAAPVLKVMMQQGWLRRNEVASSDVRRPVIPVRQTLGPTLTDEQRQTVALLRGAKGGFIPWLLRGVTGSGKTEIYLQLIADTLAAGHQALLRVPEINLTPQLEALVHARFPDTTLVSLHSGLSEGERLHHWLAAQSGEAGIVLGTRLAIFAPLPRLGLIVVDEEHDTSFKQMDGLRYSARDLALVRAKKRAIPIVLGSATPALETFQNALTGTYRTLTLAQRVNAMPPTIECVDTRCESMVDGLSQTLLNGVREMTKRGEQSLIFINRRGYAPVLMCASCGWTSGCHRCSARLVVHLKDHQLRCHLCGHQERLPVSCPQCGNQDLLPLGQGTQRIETTLTRIFPEARILRIDRDSTRRKHAWGEMRQKIADRQVDILVGTQILAKGHDFPQLNLVGVVNADSSLYSTDFRAAERLFARLTQVAGRAGRGATRGRVLVQTEFPTHPLYQALQRDDYPAYAHELLAERKQAGFPPFVHQAVLRAESAQLETALAFLAAAAHAAAPYGDQVVIYDPVPASVSRMAGLERAHLVVQSRSRSRLQSFLRNWHVHLLATAEHRVRWALDIDPQEL